MLRILLPVSTWSLKKNLLMSAGVEFRSSRSDGTDSVHSTRFGISVVFKETLLSQTPPAESHDGSIKSLSSKNM